MSLASPSAGSPKSRFAALLKKHMEAGTRPAAKPGTGRWTVKAFAGAISVASDRTVQNYTSGTTLPADITHILTAFFADDPRHTEARTAFIAAFDAARGVAPTVLPPPPPLPPEPLGPGEKAIHPDIHSIGYLFTGRDDFLDRLRQSLLRQNGNASAIRAVHGMGGIGKTRAAMEYALRYEDDYTALLFVRACDPASGVVTLERELAALTGVLRLPEQPSTEANKDAVLRWLAAHPGWLLILDNVDTPEALRAATVLARSLRTGHVLLTSRLKSTFAQDIQTLELGLLTPDAAVEYLLKASEGGRLPEPDAPAQARILAGALDHLTLGLVHAAAYIKEREITFSRYLTEWEANRERVLAWASPEVTGYPLSLAQTWLTSMEQLTPPGRALLERLSFFANDPVPEFLLDVPLPGAPEAEGLDPLLDLQRFSLITREAEADRFILHRIVRDVTNRRLGTDPEAHRARLIEALGWLNAAFMGHPQDARTWPRLDPLAPHAETLAWAADKAGIVDPTARLMSALETLFDARAQHARSEPLSRRALGIGEASLGPDHPEVAVRLNNLAALLKATNRLGEAEPLMRRALGIGEASFGPDHPDVAIRLNNLALLLQATSRLAEAEPLMRRALGIGEASLGPDHPEVAVGLNNLAQLLQATNRLGEAEPLMRRALGIDEASLGPDHPRVAVGLNNLAALLQATNRLGEAEPLMRRHLVIFLTFQRDTGHAHPHRDAAIRNYTRLLSEMGRDKAAIRAAIESAHREAGLG